MLSLIDDTLVTTSGLRDAPRQRHSGVTPLSIIAAFVALSETVGGLAATLTAGNVQIAFTIFAVGFPVLVCAAFFTILWRRAYVLYPPQEFGADVDVKQYVEAMRHQTLGNQEIVGLIRTSIQSAITSPEARVLMSQVAQSATPNLAAFENASAVLADRAVGQLHEAVVTVDVRELSMPDCLPDLVFPFSPGQQAFTFLTAIFFHVADRVPPFAYGTRWALQDVDSSKLLLPANVDWSNIRAVARSTATVSELGITAGMRLRAVKLGAAFKDKKGRQSDAA
jgi:hypothetical protein